MNLQEEQFVTSAHHFGHCYLRPPFSPVCLSVSRISQKFADRFGRNLVDRLGGWQGQINSTLVKIRIRIREFLKWFFTIEKYGWKWYIARCLRNIWMDLDETCGKVGSATRMNWFDFGEDPDPDLAYQWDTKVKLFSLAEVCTLPSAVLVHVWFADCKHPDSSKRVQSKKVKFYTLLLWE